MADERSGGDSGWKNGDDREHRAIRFNEEYKPVAACGLVLDEAYRMPTSPRRKQCEHCQALEQGIPAWWLDASHVVVAEDKRWDQAVVGDLIQTKAEHGRVVEANVDPLFCAHRFEDGAVISEPRDRMISSKRPAPDEDKAEYVKAQIERWRRADPDVRSLWTSAQVMLKENDGDS